MQDDHSGRSVPVLAGLLRMLSLTHVAFTARACAMRTLAFWATGFVHVAETPARKGHASCSMSLHLAMLFHCSLLAYVQSNGIFSAAFTVPPSNAVLE